MNAPGLYDGTVQMFVEKPRELDERHLRFLRWLAERGQFEHDVAGPSDGSSRRVAKKDRRRAS